MKLWYGINDFDDAMLIGISIACFLYASWIATEGFRK